jgi:hypothetical protein
VRLELFLQNHHVTDRSLFRSSANQCITGVGRARSR